MKKHIVGNSFLILVIVSAVGCSTSSNDSATSETPQYFAPKTSLYYQALVGKTLEIELPIPHSPDIRFQPIETSYLTPDGHCTISLPISKPLEQAHSLTELKTGYKFSITPTAPGCVNISESSIDFNANIFIGDLSTLGAEVQNLLDSSALSNQNLSIESALAEVGSKWQIPLSVEEISAPVSTGLYRIQSSALGLKGSFTVQKVFSNSPEATILKTLNQLKDNGWFANANLAAPTPNVSAGAMEWNNYLTASASNPQIQINDPELQVAQYPALDTPEDLKAALGITKILNLNGFSRNQRAFQQLMWWATSAVGHPHSYSQAGWNSLANPLPPLLNGISRDLISPILSQLPISYENADANFGRVMLFNSMAPANDPALKNQSGENFLFVPQGQTQGNILLRLTQFLYSGLVNGAAVATTFVAGEKIETQYDRNIYQGPETDEPLNPQQVLFTATGPINLKQDDTYQAILDFQTAAEANTFIKQARCAWKSAIHGDSPDWDCYLDENFDEEEIFDEEVVKARIMEIIWDILPNNPPACPLGLPSAPFGFPRGPLNPANQSLVAYFFHLWKQTNPACYSGAKASVNEFPAFSRFEHLMFARSNPGGGASVYINTQSKLSWLVGITPDSISIDPSQIFFLLILKSLNSNLFNPDASFGISTRDETFANADAQVHFGIFNSANWAEVFDSYRKINIDLHAHIPLNSSIPLKPTIYRNRPEGVAQTVDSPISLTNLGTVERVVASGEEFEAFNNDVYFQHSSGSNFAVYDLQISELACPAGAQTNCITQNAFPQVSAQTNFPGIVPVVAQWERENSCNASSNYLTSNVRILYEGSGRNCSNICAPRTALQTLSTTFPWQQLYAPVTAAPYSSVSAQIIWNMRKAQINASLPNSTEKEFLVDWMEAYTLALLNSQPPDGSFDALPVYRENALYNSNILIALQDGTAGGPDGTFDSDEADRHIQVSQYFSTKEEPFINWWCGEASSSGYQLFTSTNPSQTNFTTENIYAHHCIPVLKSYALPFAKSVDVAFGLKEGIPVRYEFDQTGTYSRRVQHIPFRLRVELGIDANAFHLQASPDVTGIFGLEPNFPTDLGALFETIQGLPLSNPQYKNQVLSNGIVIAESAATSKFLSQAPAIAGGATGFFEDSPYLNISFVPYSSLQFLNSSLKSSQNYTNFSKNKITRWTNSIANSNSTPYSFDTFFSPAYLAYETLDINTTYSEDTASLQCSEDSSQ